MFKNIGKVTVNPLFFATLALLVFTDGTGYMLMILCAALVHECGHLYALYRFHVPVEQLRFLPFGIGIVRSQTHMMSYGREAAADLAGPAVNLFLCAAALPLSLLIPLRGPAVRFLLANGMFCAVNLLPMLPLDGGRALNALLQRTLGPARAGAAMGALTCLLSLCMTVLGCFVLLATGLNYSLILIGAYLLFGFVRSLKKPKPPACPPY